MANICNKCGAMLGEGCNRCPVCNKIENISKTAKKKKKKQSAISKKNTLLSKKHVILIITILVITIIGCGALFLIINKDAPEENSNVITPPDADKYFYDNSTIITEIDANESKNVSTESEVYESLENRGFTQNAITSEFSMNGEYYEAVEIATLSSTKHPIYQTSYITQNNEIWTIYSINGVVQACPVSYNLNSSNKVQVIISETETITSYDSITNKFYETIPNDTALLVIVTETINAETLEKLTAEEIEKNA